MFLQADNGKEFSNAASGRVTQDTNTETRRVKISDEYIDKIIKEIKNLWPEVKLVRGSPRHSESNGGVERVNQTVQHKLGHWMKENNSQRWSIGCKIIQWRYNTQIHRTLGDKSPYWCTYGQHPRCGISNLPLDPILLDSLATEAQLNSLLRLNQPIEITLHTTSTKKIQT